MWAEWTVTATMALSTVLAVIVLLGHLVADGYVSNRQTTDQPSEAVREDVGESDVSDQQDPNQDLYDEIARATGKDPEAGHIPDSLPDRILPAVPDVSEQLAVDLRSDAPVLAEPDRPTGAGPVLRSESIRDVARRYRTRTPKESD